MSADFPTVDPNHRISTASKHLLSHVQPSTWEVHHRDGDDDYGFDLEVQVAPCGQVSHTFRAQLKGTTNAALSADGSTLSIALKRSTLNYYANTQDEVMLIVAIVAFGANGKADLTQSKVCWIWISDELERLRGRPHALDLGSEQERVTLRVPVAQVLDPALDVMPYLRQRIEELRASEDLAALVRQSGLAQESASGPLQQLFTLVKARPQLLSMLQGDSDGDLLHQFGAIGAQIAEGLSFIRAGRTELAEGIVRRIDRAVVVASSATIKAELLSLEAKIAMQRRRREAALDLFAQAHATNPVEKHQLAAAEVKFLIALDQGDPQSIRPIAESLAAAKTDDGLSLLVRIQTACGDYEAAQASINKIADDAKRAMPHLVLLSAQRQWSEVQGVAERALSKPPANPHDAVGLHLVAARACWQQALAGVAMEASDTELPATGLPGMDLDAVSAAWEHSEQCLRGLKELGWPLNVELLAPIAVASAGAIGKQDEVLVALGEAGAARPEYKALQENVELAALFAGNFQLALAANSRQPQDHDVLVRRTCALFQAADYPACLAAALEVLATIDSQEVRQTPMALALGCAAAAKLSRPGDQARLFATLQDVPRYREFVFLANSAIWSLKAPGSTEALEALRDGVAEFPRSRALLANLYSNLPVDDRERAREAIALAKRLRQGAALSAADQFHLIAAYFALDQWQDGESEARASIRQFGSSEKARSLLAIALEMQGRTGESVAELEAALAHGTSKISTLRNHLGICLRLGRLQAARTTLENLLGVESDRSERLQLLRLNALLMIQEGFVSDAYAVAKEVGALVDPAVEAEEGLYLNLFLGATLHHEPVPEPDREAFWARVASFAQKWPESKLFRQLTTPQGGLQTADDVHDMLDVLVGDSRERMRQWQERERQARSGELPVPFLARPSFVLHYIGDAFTLWDVAKRSKSDDLQYHLTCRLADDTRADFEVLRRDVPLLDLTALLVLRELGLFRVLFGLFPRIAIPRSTIDYISQNSRGLLVSVVARDYAESLLQMVNDNLDRIDQPSRDRSAVKVVRAQDLLSDYLQLAKSRRWTVYSDDAFTRILAASDQTSVHTLNTVDLMRFAEEEGALAAPKVAALLGQLASWNVGITVDHRYLIAALDGALGPAKVLTLRARLGVFSSHQPFATLARAIWYPKKPPVDLVQHVATLLAEILRKGGSEEDSVAALWAFWFYRFRLMTSIHAATAWDILALSLIMILRALPRGIEGLAVRIMLKVVELTVEAEAMTRERQDDVLRRLGSTVAEVAGRNLALGEDLRARLGVALPPGTQEGDLFSDGYFTALKASAAS